MKSPDWNEEELEARRARIKTPDALRAFDTLTAYGVSSLGWYAGPSGHGFMKNFQFKAAGESPFSFTSNRGHLLLYLRSAGVRVLRTNRAELVEWFAEAKDGSKGELTVEVRTEADASRVISKLLERWLALKESEANAKPERARASLQEVSGSSSIRIVQESSPPSRNNWSRLEVEATVADYFAMLMLELSGQPYNKAAHNRALQSLLSNRSQAAVELKHQNISAILLELGSVYISGYKPRGNYQDLLQEIVAARLETDRNFETVALHAVEREAPAVPPTDLRNILVPAPRVNRVGDIGVARTYVRKPIRCDYLERDARNRSLGLAGELFIAEFEAQRLHRGGHVNLSNRVEHVARTQGDGLGYDVLSFEPSGKERFIEVKTTSFGPLTPFYISRNELSFSEERPAEFVLARVHEFRTEAKFFELKGSMSKNFKVVPVTYQARL